MLRTLAIATSILVAAPALAQNAAPGVPPNAPSVPPEKIAPPDQNLSSKLSQQKGAIVPRNVDPGITVKPPATGGGNTPVIPGSPGGNLSLVPK